MVLDIKCNFRKCRMPLTSQAWVTTCSHAFCVEHGKRQFKRNAENTLTCPACGTELRDKFDVIQADLKPCETFKSIVLAGMKPDMIMDVAMRAISFWSYQVEQEALYQENLAKYSKEKFQCLEEVNTLNEQKLKAKLQSYKRKILSLQTELNKKRKQADDFTARSENQTRKIHKLSFQLNAQKRKDIRNNFEDNHDNQEKCMDISDLLRKRSPAEAFVFRPRKEADEARQIYSPKTPVFDLRHQNKNQIFQFRPVLF